MELEAFHIACYGNAPYWPGCAGHIMLMVLIPALCIVMLIATIFHSSQQNTDCDALFPRHACLVAWCMHGSMLQSNVNGPSIHS